MVDFDMKMVCSIRNTATNHMKQIANAYDLNWIVDNTAGLPENISCVLDEYMQWCIVLETTHQMEAILRGEGQQ